LRHISSALARLAEGGRLVAITGANLSPENPSWRDSFVRLQERGRVVFSAAINGRVYARQGTNVETRLTVIDRVPAGDPDGFPDSGGTRGDTARLLEWVSTLVPPRPGVTLPETLGRASLSIARRPPAAPTLPTAKSPNRSAAVVAEPAAVELAYETVDWALET